MRDLAITYASIEFSPQARGLYHSSRFLLWPERAR